MNTRRGFIAAGVSAAWIASQWKAIAAAAEHAHGAMAAGAAASTLREVLTEAQAREVDAFAACIVPSVDGRPGAREAGVVIFMDRALATFFAQQRGEFLAALGEFSAGVPGGSFAALDADAQVAHLRSVDTTPFFGQMRILTIAGLLANPSYGGNRDRLGWQLVGFADDHVYAPPFGYYDRDYPGFEAARRP